MNQTTALKTEYRAEGRILSGVGGLYTIRLDAGEAGGPLAGTDVFCRARGVFRHDGITPLVGDRVTVRYTDKSFTYDAGNARPDAGGTDVLLDDILPRSSVLIRPAMANLDLLLIAVAAAAPAPMTDLVDKLFSVAEYHGIEAALVIGKCELDPAKTKELTEIYTLAGYPVFPLSAKTGEGVDALRAYVEERIRGHIAAISGASGVGKSSLLNVLFPDFRQETSGISRRTERGKHTTRRVELLTVPGGGYLADTPGFSLLDFTRFDFFGLEDLAETMREFRPFLGSCRYTSCTHTGEGPADCAVTRAVREGRIAPSRHKSYLSMYQSLKNKHDWEKPAAPVKRRKGK